MIVAAAVIILLVASGLISWLVTRGDAPPSMTIVAATTSPPATTAPTVEPTPAPTETPTTKATPATKVTDTPSMTFLPPDIPHLQDYMLQLVNKERRSRGLRPVAWDVVAATAGQFHAEEMVKFGYLSHWNLEGHGPDFRYVQQGGMDAVSENVYSLDHSLGGEPTTATEWEAYIDQAHESLMGSQGHRDTVLRPSNTHVGIGMAYDPANGRLRIAQEFVVRQTILSAIARQVALNDVVTIEGRLLNDTAEPLLNLAYEPFPQPLSLAELAATNTYLSPAEVYEAINIIPDSDGNFSLTVSLNHENQPGLYHLRLWVHVDGQPEPVMVANPIVMVR